MHVQRGLIGVYLPALAENRKYISPVFRCNEKSGIAPQNCL